MYSSRTDVQYENEKVERRMEADRDRVGSVTYPQAMWYLMASIAKERQGRRIFEKSIIAMGRASGYMVL